eukprot:1844154-Prymnesium_polylepis.1
MHISVPTASATAVGVARFAFGTGREGWPTVGDSDTGHGASPRPLPTALPPPRSCTCSPGACSLSHTHTASCPTPADATPEPRASARRGGTRAPARRPPPQRRVDPGQDPFC